MDERLEPCDAGGWKTRVDDFDAVADRIRDVTDLDVDTANMIIAHVDQVKISFVRSSGVLTIHTDDRAAAEAVLETL